MTLVVPKMANTIADRIAQCRGFVVPLVPKFMPKRLSGAKFSSPLERLATMKSDKVDFAAKEGPKPTLLTAETDLPAEKEEIAHTGSCEKSTKPISEEAAEICAILKPDLLNTWTRVPSLLMVLKGLFSQVPLRSIRSNIEGLLCLL